MSIKTLSTLSLSILTASLLSACGGGGDDDVSNNNTSNVISSSTTTPVNTTTLPADTKGPFSLALNGPNPQTVTLGGAFVDQGASSYSASGENLSSTITESNNVNAAVAGCYQQTYLVSDTSGESKSLTRTVFVGTDLQRHSPNTAPITQELSATNNYNSSSTINLLDSAYDADCDALTISNLSTPNVGSVKINTDGTVTFDPLGNVGSHFFMYTISDAYGGSSTSGVSISSVDPDDGNDSWPTITNETITISKNTSILIDVLANDIDADGDMLVLDMFDSPVNGTVQKQNNKIFYTPNLDFVGEDSFYYGVHDNHGHGGSGLVVITVTQ